MLPVAFSRPIIQSTRKHLSLLQLSKINPSSNNVLSSFQQRRHLNIHEYQSVQLMKKAGINVPNGIDAETPEDAKLVASVLTYPVIVKAQVHAGGRGRGEIFCTSKETGRRVKVIQGGVHVAKSAEEVEDLASKMLGHMLVTKQTGVEGRAISSVFIVPTVKIAREVYFAILMDRAMQGPVMVGSSMGGMAIEDVAKTHPEVIFKEKIDIIKGLTVDQAMTMAKNLGFTDAKGQAHCAGQIQKLYKLFIESDATQVEINPMIEDAKGLCMCLDAKITFDDNANFRQKEIFALVDDSQRDAREVQAAKMDINYIGLDGSIGCLVNGAGLAMATMDVIKLHGGTPANFLDIGGGASEQQVMQAFKLLTSDPKVKAILVNIFGGIMQCDIIARGIVAAAATIRLTVPLVVRLQGTNVVQGKKIIDESGLRIITTDDLDDAAAKVCNITRIVEMAQESHIDVKFALPL